MLWCNGLPLKPPCLLLLATSRERQEIVYFRWRKQDVVSCWLLVSGIGWCNVCLWRFAVKLNYGALRCAHHVNWCAVLGTLSIQHKSLHESQHEFLCASHAAKGHGMNTERTNLQWLFSYLESIILLGYCWYPLSFSTSVIDQGSSGDKGKWL